MGIKYDRSSGLSAIAKGFDAVRIRGRERRNKNGTNEIGVQKKGLKRKDGEQYEREC